MFWLNWEYKPGSLNWGVRTGGSEPERFSFLNPLQPIQRRAAVISDDEIRRRAKTCIKFTDHARLAMREDNITVDDVISTLKGEVIEKYLDDKPFPSCLIYGQTVNGKPLHLVCAMPKHVDMLIVITTYIPTEDRWTRFRERKK